MKAGIKLNSDKWRHTWTRIRQEWKSKASVELGFLFIISSELSQIMFSNKNGSSGHRENLNQQEGNRKDWGWKNEASGMGWDGEGGFSLFQILANKSGLCLYLCNTTTCPECSCDPIIFRKRKKTRQERSDFQAFSSDHFHVVVSFIIQYSSSATIKFLNSFKMATPDLLSLPRRRQNEMIYTMK